MTILLYNPPDCLTERIPNAVFANGYCGFVWKTGVATARGLAVAPNGDIIVIARGSSAILAVWEDASGVATSKVLATQSGVNHGITIYNGYLYASSDRTVWRWPYGPANYRQTLENRQTVVSGLPAGGHSTRTLAFDELGRLYISIGSASNLDATSARARIVRYNDFATATFPLVYPSGSSVFADGLRNEVGMRFDLQGRLWGVENGMDNLGAPPSRNDFGDIHEDNPAEEVNMFLESDAGKFYGYPYCWTEGPSTSGKLLSFPQGQGVGTQWATYLNTPQTDVWCRNESNVVRPKFSMPAHSAPLDILFYNGTSFPGLAGKAAFVARHGSWNRPAERSGRTVDILHLNEEGIPTSMEGLLWGPSSSFAVRPVALSVGACAAYTECLFVSDDTTNSIYAIAYAPEHSNQPPTPPPQVAPPVAIGQLASLELSTGVVLSYVLHDNDTMMLSVTVNSAQGWLALGFNPQGGMIGSTAVIGFQTGSGPVTGQIRVPSTRAEDIMSSNNNTGSMPWMASNAVYTRTNDNITLTFEAPTTFFEVNQRTIVVVAYHGTETANFDSLTLPIHTGAGSYAMFFSNATLAGAPTAQAPDAGTDNGSAPNIQITSLLIVVLATLASLL